MVCFVVFQTSAMKQIFTNAKKDELKSKTYDIIYNIVMTDSEEVRYESFKKAKGGYHAYGTPNEEEIIKELRRYAKCSFNTTIEDMLQSSYNFHPFLVTLMTRIKKQLDCPIITFLAVLHERCGMDSVWKEVYLHALFDVQVFRFVMLKWI